MLYECHMHLFMDGVNYKAAAALHRNGVQEADVRAKLKAYADGGVRFLREGGDAFGVSELAARLAPEYGIDYRSPVFAIHHRGHYGGIVGRAYSDRKEYCALVKEAAARGADFIKIMISGILDFSREGALTEDGLSAEEIRELIRIAHGEGFAVMAHANGADCVRAAVLAGVDSIEHGNFIDEDCLQAMAAYHTIWVPTHVTISNLIGSGRFDDASLRRVAERQSSLIREGFRLGVCIAPGSDAGAYRVPHVQGIRDEYRELIRLFEESGISGACPPSASSGENLNSPPSALHEEVVNRSQPVLSEGAAGRPQPILSEEAVNRPQPVLSEEAAGRPQPILSEKADNRPQPLLHKAGTVPGPAQPAEYDRPAPANCHAQEAIRELTAVAETVFRRFSR